MTNQEKDLITLQDYISELIDAPTHIEHNVFVYGEQKRFPSWKLAQDYCDIKNEGLPTEHHYHVSPKIVQS